MVVVLAVCWIGAVFVSVGGGVSLGQTGAAIALVGAGFFLTGGAPLRSRLWVVPLGIFGVAAGLGVRAPPAPRVSAGGTARVTCEVCRLAYRTDRALLDCEVVEGTFIDGGRALRPGTRLRLATPLGADPPRGSSIRAMARLRPMQSYRNLSPHPAWPWVRPQAFQGRVIEGSLEVVQEPGFAWLHEARQRVRQHLLASLGTRASAIARALALGEAGAIARKDRQTVAAAGLAHVLAVSGLHVAMVSGLWVVVFRQALLSLSTIVNPTRVAAIAGIPLSVVYAAFAGGTPSGWRAAATASIAWALVASGRKPRSLSVAALAALVLSIPNPILAVRPAFLLSVLATAAIVTGGSCARSALSAAAATTTRAIVATTPVVWWCFGNVPWVGWLANLVLLPLGTFALIPLANLHAVGGLLPPLARVTAPLFEAVAESFFTVCAFLVSLFPETGVPPLTLAQGVVVTAGCFGLLVTTSWRYRLAVLLTTLALFLVGEAAAGRRSLGTMRVEFLDVGQGDSALVEMPDGRLMLIDTGGGVLDPGRWVLAPLLEAKRRTEIDVVVITHPHPDHYEGLAALLEEVEIGEMWTNRQAQMEESSGRFITLVSRLRARGTRVRHPAELCNGRHLFGDATVHVLWPCPAYDPGLDPNDNSLVLKVEHEGHSILFTGDIEADAEKMLAAESSALVADVLKVAHHGSNTSSRTAFLNRVRPRLSVVSSGAGNRYGHPAAGVLKRLSQASGEVLRIDETGSVILTSRKGELRVHTWKDATRRALP